MFNRRRFFLTMAPRDFLLELSISLAGKDLLRNVTENRREAAADAQQRIARLIECRSPQQVARMEARLRSRGNA